ncbi:hypothetical protein MMC11_005634 [Xylographa trunciseda]|nr:hypothetical protein [Xylographa trunciseda]
MEGTGSGFIHDVEKKAYWSLIEGIRDRYPDFVKNFELQDVDQCNKGRAALLEFHEVKKAHITDFGASGKALDEYLKGLANGSTSSRRDKSTQHGRLSKQSTDTGGNFRELEYIRFSDSSNFGKPLGNLHGWFHTWDTSWRAEAFHSLLYQQLATGSVANGSRHAMRVFGVEATDTVVDTREKEDWQALQLSVTSLKEQLANLISGYSQEASIQESKTSNYQARSVGRLTSLATILVPFSVTAALFSKGGYFQDGQSLFWVFGVIAIPIAAVLYLGISFYERKKFDRDKKETRVADDTHGIV